jgi:hypothetical protein
MNDQWQDALEAAEAGRPDALANLIEAENIPLHARERAARFILGKRLKNTGRPAKRNDSGFTPTQEKRADAYAEFCRLQPFVGDDEALRRVAIMTGIPKHTLERIVKHGVTPVNAVLRARGII